jgi:hypothetical protein
MSDLFVNDQHPYGVKPPGNAYFCTSIQAQVRPRGLGAAKRIQDEALIEILGFLSATELGRISCTSRALYVYAHHSDLWRDLVLRKWEGKPLHFQCNWKETFMTSLQRAQGMDESILASVKHCPICVDGIYSNLLHRSWTCHTCDLATACPGFYDHDDIAHRASHDLSTDEFVAQYEKPNKPLIITGAVDYWPALKRWSESFLIDSSKTEASGPDSADGEGPTFRATSATAPLAATFTLQGYFRYLHETHEEAPLYLFDRNFMRKLQSLKGHYDVPRYFRSVDDSSVYSTDKGLSGTDLFRLFGPEARPDYRWLICGPKRSGSIFHIDPNSTNAWNVSVQGRKKWIFYPPHVSPPGVVMSHDGADVTVPISTGEWLLSFWEQHLEARKNPDPTMRPLEAVVQPGEVIFVPHGYWHMVVNLDHCIALTHNYVSTSNLANCLRFLREKTDQISGVRDRPDAVDADTMHELFLAKLASAKVMDDENLDAIIECSRERPKRESVLPSVLRQKRKIKDVGEPKELGTFSFSFF